MFEKPREEMSYKSLYPGLSVTKKIPLFNKIYKPADPEPFTYKKARTYKNTEKDDLNAIEYCLNELDQDFIVKYLKNNAEFCKKYEPIVFELYELIMDRIGKEWRFTQLCILKNYYKQKDSKHNTNDNTECDICTSNEIFESNVILRCNGCNILVHQECYGVPNLEKYTELEKITSSFCFVNRLWFCRKCLFFKDLTPKCKYCEIDGNAYKPIYGSKRWGHILCAKFIESLSFSNLVFLEPIEEQSVDDKNLKNKSLEVCKICTSKKGRFIKCSYKTCNKTYHVTCGINENYYFDVENCISYCHKHDPLAKQKNDKINNDSYSNLLDLNCENMKTFNYERIKAKPVIRKKIRITDLKESFIFKVKNIKPRFTDFIANRILASDLCQYNEPMMLEFLYEVGCFWNIKNNRSYDPGDFLSMSERNWNDWNQQRNILCCNKSIINLSNFKQLITVDESEIKNQGTKKSVSKEEKEHNDLFLETIRKKCNARHIKELQIDDYFFFLDNLKSLRALVCLSRSRKMLEIELYTIKLRIIRYKKNADFAKMLILVDKLVNYKKFEVFYEPVTEKIAPLYFTYIKEPMSLKVIEEKLNFTAYDYGALIKDLNLIVANCRHYNCKSPYFLKLCNEFEAFVKSNE